MFKTEKLELGMSNSVLHIVYIFFYEICMYFGHMKILWSKEEKVFFNYIVPNGFVYVKVTKRERA